MDLGNKTANNLLSKDFKVSSVAAKSLVDCSDTEAYKVLAEKSEFIFDFIKEKILKNLIKAVDENNVLNLFNFTNIYSEDFKDFILTPLISKKNKIIEDRFFDLLQNGTSEQKTFSTLFFTKNKKEGLEIFAKKNITSPFEPLKIASIKLLAEYSIKEEYNNCIENLKSEKDEFEKIESIEFLTTYGDKAAFGPIYEYFSTKNLDENIAQNLLFLKSFEELVKENNEDIILKIYSTILRAFPDNVQFQEIDFYLQEIFDFLVESENNFSLLLNFYLKNKLDILLNNEAYSIDITKDETKQAKELFHKLSLFLECFDLVETIQNSLDSCFKTEVLIALELAQEIDISFKKQIEKICISTEDNEILLHALRALKNKKELEDAFIDEIEQKAKNETVKAEIKSLK